MSATKRPEGAAGEDTRFAIEESVNSHLERMFMQAAKNDALGYSIGRASGHGAGPSEHRRFQALRAECDAAVSFHAGRALDLALQLFFAVTSNQIFGRASRENPGADPIGIVMESLRNLQSPAGSARTSSPRPLSLPTKLHCTRALQMLRGRTVGSSSHSFQPPLPVRGATTGGSTGDPALGPQLQGCGPLAAHRSRHS